MVGCNRVRFQKETTSVPKRPGPASILKACAKGGRQEKACRSAARLPRKSLQAGRPAAKKKPAGPAGKACRPGVAGKSVSHHHRHSAWHRTERWWVYGDSGITEVDWATGSMYLRDPGEDRRHVILLSYNEIHNLTFPTFDLTRDFVDPHSRVVSHLLTLFLRSSSQNRSFSRIPFGCRERCGGVLMMGSLPSSSAISPHRPEPKVGWPS